jgi:uncharacterized protein (DUF58 family)
MSSLSERVARFGAPAFRRLWRFDRVLRGKLTPAGWLVATLAGVSAVFGINTREAMLYQLFGLTVGLLAVAWAASRRLPLQGQAERRLPRWATAGAPFDYALTLRLEGRAAHAALGVEDLLVPGVSPITAGTAAAAAAELARGFAQYKTQADRGRNVFDRLVGYPRWVAYMRLRIGAQVVPRELPAGAAAAAGTREVTLKMRCLPLRRGVLHFDAVRLAQTEPLGLMRAHAWVRRKETLLVLPRTHPVAAPLLAGSRRLQPGGVALAGHIGEAEEFIGLREYRPGDTPRRIHWKAWARTGEPVVKEHQDEFFVRHALVLDTFGPADGEVDEETFEAAISLAASLVVMPRSSESLLDLMFVERRAYTMTQGRGVGAASELLRVLAALTPSPGAPFAPLAEAVALHAGRISSAICVLLAWDEARRRLVAGLRARGLPVRVWVVRSAEALDMLEPGPMATDPANLRAVMAHSLAQELLRP